MSKRLLYGKTRYVPDLKSDTDILSWLKRGKTRLKIFEAVTTYTLPSEVAQHIAKDRPRAAESDFTQSSRGLAELETVGLVECQNPQEKTGRLYKLTKKGQRIKERLQR